MACVFEQRVHHVHHAGGMPQKHPFFHFWNQPFFFLQNGVLLAKPLFVGQSTGKDLTQGSCAHRLNGPPYQARA